MDLCCRYWNRMEVARKAANRIEAPYWFIYQGHELHYNPAADRYSFSASRMMANAALLYGVKGLSCYIECDGVLDPETGDTASGLRNSVSSTAKSVCSAIP